MTRYQKGLQKFLEFITRRSFYFNSIGQLDDLLAEWKHCDFISKSEFEATIAAVEMALPSAKHHLPWSRQIVAAWNVTHVARHTVPLSEGPAVLLACCMSSRNHAKLGAGLILQQALGLRPSEILGIEFDDALLPEDRGFPATGSVSIALGVRTGTKAKRAQCVTLSSNKKVALVRWLKSLSKSGERLIPYTYENYRRILNVVSKDLKLEHLGFTPHSPRSGFATDLVASGTGFAKTRELGRWVSETSLRTYLDLSAVSSIAVALKTQHLNDAVAYCCKNVLTFFVGSELLLASDPSSPSCVGATDAGKRLTEGPGRPVLHSGAVRSAVDDACSLGVDDIAEGASHRDPSRSEEPPLSRRGRGRGRRGHGSPSPAHQGAAGCRPGRRGRGRA